jgi:hypothetical protein
MTFKPKRGDIVEVSDSSEYWNKRIFLLEIEGAYEPIQCVKIEWENYFKNGKKFKSTPWTYMREPIKKTTLTKAQIAERLNIPFEELEITD